MIRRLKHKFVNWLIRNWLVALTEEDILTITNKGWFMNNRQLDQEEVSFIKQEARDFSDSVLWRVIKNDIRYQAQTRMFEKAAQEESAVFGSAMLYNLQIIEKFLDNCKKM